MSFFSRKSILTASLSLTRTSHKPLWLSFRSTLYTYGHPKPFHSTRHSHSLRYVSLLFGSGALVLGLSLYSGLPSSIIVECDAPSSLVSEPETIDLTEKNMIEKLDMKEHGRREKSTTKVDDMSAYDIAKEIGSALAPDWLLLVLVIGVTGASGAVSVYTPLAVGQVVSIVQKLLQESSGSIDLSSLNKPALWLLTLFASQGFLTFLDIALVARLGENLASRLRKKLFRGLLAQDISFFDTHMHGEMMQRLSGDVSDFKHTFKVCVTQGLKAISQITGSSIALYTLSPSLTLSIVATMPVLYLSMNAYGAYLRHLSKLARTAESEASGMASESLANIRTVRSFAAEDMELDRHSRKVERASRLNRMLGFHIGLFQGLTTVSIGGMVLMVLFYGGQLVAKGDMTGGQLMAYMVSTQAAQKSFTTLGVLFGQVVKAAGAASRIFEYLREKPAIPIQGGYIPPYIMGKIEFRHVSFAYPSRPGQPILEDLNLVIPKGSVVALCGLSGSGKSTVGQLIERFYDPDQGEILLDGIHLKELDPRWLRRHIGYIHQEPILFATSIYENILYGNPDATHEEVVKAAKEANAAEFISNFPKGFATLVGERGVTLSGGQKQRIAIARALLRNPQILILDEATSALDTESERVVQDALERLMKGRTVLIIAHRLSTIRSADQIVVMSGLDRQSSRNQSTTSDTTTAKGNILEMGTHESLLKQKGAYYELYTSPSNRID